MEKWKREAIKTHHPFCRVGLKTGTGTGPIGHDPLTARRIFNKLGHYGDKFSSSSFLTVAPVIPGWWKMLLLAIPNITL